MTCRCSTWSGIRTSSTRTRSSGHSRGSGTGRFTTSGRAAGSRSLRSRLLPGPASWPVVSPPASRSAGTARRAWLTGPGSGDAERSGAEGRAALGGQFVDLRGDGVLHLVREPGDDPAVIAPGGSEAVRGHRVAELDQPL